MKKIKQIPHKNIYSWNEYDYAVAEAQLFNYGCIYLDQYNCPIDREYELEEIYKNEKIKEATECN